MFVFYEHHRDATNKVVLTEIKLSSSQTKWHIEFWKPKEKLLFDLIKPLLKNPSTTFRTYEESTNVWSYLEGWGVTVLNDIEAVTKGLGGVTCTELPDLAEQAVSGSINLSGRKTAKMKAEEFFYNHGVAQSAPSLTKEQISEKLMHLLGSVIDKSSYRKAALKYHPDRNNGDGSKMSELNMLWRMYNA